MKTLATTALYLSLALAPSLLLEGCGKKSTDELESLRDRVCACKTKACVEELRKNSADLEKRLGELSAQKQEKVLEISVEMMECAERIGASPK